MVCVSTIHATETRQPIYESYYGERGLFNIHELSLYYWTVMTTRQHNIVHIYKMANGF